MDVSRPYAAVCPTLDGEVLSVLARTSRPLSGRDVARLVERGSQGGVNRVLRRLAGHGIVDVQEAGSALLYALNRDHLAAPAVMILDGLRAELGRRLSEAIAAWEVPPLHASMFGSAARGDGDTESDIDVFIVRPDEVEEDDARWRGQLDALATAVRRWTGNHAGIAEVSGRETRRLKLEQPPVYEDLLAHAIDLFGVPVATILEGADR